MHARIHLIEDEESVSIAASKILEWGGNEVTVSKNGLDAVNHYRDSWREIDIVILDLILPEMSGYDTFKEIRSINPQARVLLSSGYTVDGEARELLQMGALDFIKKPYEAAELVNKVAEIVSSG